MARLNAAVRLRSISEGIFRLYQPAGNQTIENARDRIWQINRDLEDFRHGLSGPLAAFDDVDDAEKRPVSSDSDAGLAALLKFDVAIHYFSAKMSVCFPSLAMQAEEQIREGDSGPSLHRDDAAEECINAATTLVSWDCVPVVVTTTR
jgi:hypothetical protein